MNPFMFQNTTKIYFGKDQLENLSIELKNYGSKVLLTYGGGSIKKIGLYDKVVNQLQSHGIEFIEFGGIEPNPRHSTVNKAAAICKNENIDVILAVGGGSTIDASKAIAAATFYHGDCWDLVTHKAPVTKALPLLTVLTISATGSEMDSGGVISNIETHEKYGLLHPLLLPKVSFLDPTLTYSVSEYQTASGAADILAHIFDLYYFTLHPQLSMIHDVIESIIKTVVKYGPIAIKDPENYEARANLMWASTWALNGFLGTGIIQAPTCHMIEHELSAHYDITHGHGLAIITPHWLSYVLNDKTAPIIKDFGVNIFGIDSSSETMEGAKHAIDRLSKFYSEDLGLSSTLSSLNIDYTNFETMAKNACRNNLIKGFVELSKNDVVKILQMSL